MCLDAGADATFKFYSNCVWKSSSPLVTMWSHPLLFVPQSLDRALSTHIFISLTISQSVEVDTKTAKRYAKVEAKIGYTFVRKGLLLQALTHPSFYDSHNGNEEEHSDTLSTQPNYQRMEFIGDAILGNITRFLFLVLLPLLFVC